MDLRQQLAERVARKKKGLKGLRGSGTADVTGSPSPSVLKRVSQHEGSGVDSHGHFDPHATQGYRQGAASGPTRVPGRRRKRV